MMWSKILGFALAVFMICNWLTPGTWCDPLPPETGAVSSPEIGTLPGQCAIDLWGWFFPLYYQQPDPNVGEGLDYFLNLMKESYKWGSNFIEWYPNHVVYAPADKETDIVSGPSKFYSCGYTLWWEDTPEWPRPKGYLQDRDEKWTHREYKAMVEKAHELDSMLSWWVNPELVKAKGEDGKWHVQPDYTGQTEVIKENLNALRWVSHLLANSIEHDYRFVMDGFGYEHWYKDNGVDTNTAMWRYNPGSFAEYRYYGGQGPSPSQEAPNYIRNASFGTVPMRTKGYRLQDLDSEWGKIYASWEGNCRFMMGFTPDYMINNTCWKARRRLLHPDQVLDTCIWWISPMESTTKIEDRDYVYGCSQDPVRSAAASFLTHEIQLFSDVYMREDSLWREGTPFVQNNYFRLYLRTDRDGGTLVIDRDRVANFSTALAFDKPLNLFNINGFLAVHRPGFSDSYTRRFLLRDTKREFELPERAGHRAVLREKRDAYAQPSLWHLLETRDYIAYSDSPILLVDMNRKWDDSGKHSIVTSMGVVDELWQGYDVLVAGEKEYREQAWLPAADFEVFTLRDSSGQRPDLTLMLVEKGSTDKVMWDPSNAIYLESGDFTEEHLKIALCIHEKRSSPENLRSLLAALREPEVVLSFGEKQSVEVKNEQDTPLVKTIRIDNADEHPYYVDEYGWWTFRGAQQSREHKGSDYLKVYLPAKGSAEIQHYGFINGVVKAGWGCQYILAFKDISGHAQRAECTTRVMSITPFIFAPRVQFAQPVKRAFLNGKPWSYFEHDVVFLPNRKGDYQVSVEYGAPEEPSLARTFVRVESAQWNNKELIFDAKLPVWTKKLPAVEGKELKFTAVIRKNGKKLRQNDEVEIVEETPGAALIRFSPGLISIKFQ